MTDGSVEVRVQGISKRFDGVWAVKNVSFTAPAGSFLTLLGPSGCGKTTSLRLIAGLEILDEGEIFVEGKPISGLPPWKRRLGLVFQSYALFPHMTVYENVAFGLQMRSVPRQDIGQRVAEALSAVSLPGLDQRYPRQLSGGQQQRVALARSLVLRPQVLLLDEPLSNLDAKLRAEMRFELKRIQRESGITTIYVTHDQEEALALSDVIVVLRDGEICQIGSPEEIWDEPCDEFVAGFLNVENMLRAQVVEQHGQGSLEIKFANGETALLEARNRREFNAGDEIVIGMRASSIQLFSERPESVGNVFPAVVADASYRGDFISYEILTPFSPEPLRATAPAEQRLPRDIWFRPRPEATFVFKG